MVRLYFHRNLEVALASKTTDHVNQISNKLIDIAKESNILSSLKVGNETTLAMSPKKAEKYKEKSMKAITSYWVDLMERSGQSPKNASGAKKSKGSKLKNLVTRALDRINLS